MKLAPVRVFSMKTPPDLFTRSNLFVKCIKEVKINLSECH